MTPFEREVQDRIASNAEDKTLKDSARAFLSSSLASKYSYNYFWLGRPIIQYPQDMLAMQAIIWSVKPDLVIETGIAHGGSLIFSASMLELNAACGGPRDAEVLGVDIDIRAHNRKAIEAHPMFKRISMIEGSSIAPEIIERVTSMAAHKQRVMVCLDSNHTHDHVLSELEAYAPLTSVESYCVVFDTIIEDMTADMFPDRVWGPGNNPKTAVWEYLHRLKGDGRKAADGTSLFFEIDKAIEYTLLITAAPDGYLKRIGKPTI
jgi:cephalosporin hydroxylase